MDNIADNLLNTLKQRLGQTWERLSQEHAELIETILRDAATLQTRALATPPTDTAGIAAQQAEAQEIDAQLANLGAGAAGEVRQAFWKTVEDGLEVAFNVMVKAVLA